MRWKPYKPEEGEVRYQKRFAWWPKECVSGEGYDAEHTEMVWLEHYIQSERWCLNKWIAGTKPCWRYTLGEFTRRKLTGTLEPPKPVAQAMYVYGLGQNQIQGYFSQSSVLASNYQPLYPGQSIYSKNSTTQVPINVTEGS